MKLVAKYHLEKAMKIVVVLSALQEVQGAMAELDENVEGDHVLYLLSVMMMLLGMALDHEGPSKVSQPMEARKR